MLCHSLSLLAANVSVFLAMVAIEGVAGVTQVLAQLGLDAEAGVEMTIEDGALVLRRPASPARTGWAEAARSIAEAGDDELAMGEFGNAEDSELVW
jgi:antitoxin MazE